MSDEQKLINVCQTWTKRRGQNYRLNRICIRVNDPELEQISKQALSVNKRVSVFIREKILEIYSYQTDGHRSATFNSHCSDDRDDINKIIKESNNGRRRN